MQATINIDLVPYQATADHAGTVIHDVGGSILANLDTDPDVTQWRGSEERIYTLHPETLRPIFAQYDPDSGEFRIDCDLDSTIQWLSDNFDAIADIGWECLLTERSADRLSADLRHY